MGISLAEEKARQTVVNLGEKLKGPEKLEIALGFVMALVKQYNLDDVAEAKIVDYIEARLGISRDDPFRLV
jgi:hypothetical protein